MTRRCADCQWWVEEQHWDGECRGGPPVSSRTWPHTADHYEWIDVGALIERDRGQAQYNMQRSAVVAWGEDRADCEATAHRARPTVWQRIKGWFGL